MATFVLDFLPLACAFCGERLQLVGSRVADFFAGKVQTCKCGTRYAYVGEHKAVISVGDKVIATCGVATIDDLFDAIDRDQEQA
jgi:hypothetical protein